MELQELLQTYLSGEKKEVAGYSRFYRLARTGARSDEAAEAGRSAKRTKDPVRLSPRSSERRRQRRRPRRREAQQKENGSRTAQKNPADVARELDDWFEKHLVS